MFVSIHQTTCSVGSVHVWLALVLGSVGRHQIGCIAREIECAPAMDDGLVAPVFKLELVIIAGCLVVFPKLKLTCRLDAL